MSYGNVALLPMKANSERVRGKNFRIIAGKPLYQWILDTLLAAQEIDRVVINTDAQQELEESGFHDRYGDERVELRNRLEEIRGDFVSMNLVLADDIVNIDAETYLMTHTTNPLLSTDTISEMIRIYHDSVAANQFDSLFTVNEFRTRFYDTNANPINHDPETLIRTQDLPPYFEENSLTYIFSRASFASTGARIGKRPKMFATPPLESVDIDEPADWFMAESLLLRGTTPSDRKS